MERSSLTDAVILVPAETSSSFACFSKPLSTYHALCGLSTHLPLTTLPSASFSYTSVWTLLSVMLPSRDAPSCLHCHVLGPSSLAFASAPKALTHKSASTRAFLVALFTRHWVSSVTR